MVKVSLAERRRDGRAGGGERGVGRGRAKEGGGRVKEGGGRVKEKVKGRRRWKRKKSKKDDMFREEGEEVRGCKLEGTVLELVYVYVCVYMYIM